MAVAVSLITDGKTVSPKHPVLHLLVGAGLGLLIGLLFSRKLGANKAK